MVKTQSSEAPASADVLAQLDSQPLAQRAFSLMSRQNLSGTVYLLLDHSTSMADDDKLLQLKRGALRFFGEAWQRNYAVGAIGFATQARCLLSPSRNPHRFGRSLATLRAQGRTAMARALKLGVRRLARRRGKRMLILITDGLPDDRTATRQAALEAKACNIELVVVGTDGADKDFLASLLPKPELLYWAKQYGLESEISATAQEL